MEGKDDRVDPQVAYLRIADRRIDAGLGANQTISTGLRPWLKSDAAPRLGELRPWMGNAECLLRGDKGRRAV
jgi:hypothetical protein